MTEGAATHDRSSLPARISAQLEAGGVEVPASVIAGCAIYLQLLAHWNRGINLTALPVTEPVPPTTIDKLIVEPLCALDLIPSGNSVWLDLGTGGGSPAIPLRLASPLGHLTMVEGREKKCAFLREAVRILALAATDVLTARFEEVVPDIPVDLVTLRAVRLDDDLGAQLARWLKPGGAVLCFGTQMDQPGFTEERRRQLPDTSWAREYRRL